MDRVETRANQGTVSCSRVDQSTLLVTFAGPWHLKQDVPSPTVLDSELRSSPPIQLVSFDTSKVTNWDSGLVSFLVKTSEKCRASGIEQNREGLMPGLRRLLELA